MKGSIVLYLDLAGCSRFSLLPLRFELQFNPIYSYQNEAFLLVPLLILVEVSVEV